MQLLENTLYLYILKLLSENVWMVLNIWCIQKLFVFFFVCFPINCLGLTKFSHNLLSQKTFQLRIGSLIWKQAINVIAVHLHKHFCKILPLRFDLDLQLINPILALLLILLLYQTWLPVLLLVAQKQPILFVYLIGWLFLGILCHSVLIC